MRDHILIYVNGRRHDVRGERVFQSLSDFLRYDLCLVGTKVVCAEGDCGSCTVFLGEARDGRMHYRTVTSCIQYLFQLDCTHIVTIEGLSTDRTLNPIQEAMVRCHGAQCGFCTPGFIVAMHAMLESRQPVNDQRVRDACVGNLCRCTGYEPIIRAGLETDAAQVRPLDQLFPSNEIAAALSLQAADSVLIRADGRTFFKPVTIRAAAEFKRENPHCTIVAGGTDIGVQMNKGLRDPRAFMGLWGLTELRGIGRENDTLVVGATASLSELERACAEALPEYARMLHWFGSPPIRNAGTLGGNIANGSPIGDTMPALFVLNSEIELTGTTGARRVNINDFYTGYRKTVMSDDELITRVFISLPAEGEIFKLYKISKRKDLDISAFTAAFWLRRSNGLIVDARIAYGGVGPVILRLRRTEEFLRGNTFSEEVFDEAAELARQEITPISDVRGSSEYRFQLAENVLRKLYADHTGDACSSGILPAHQ
jgi:xanthine dehydrogenase small subunit